MIDTTDYNFKLLLKKKSKHEVKTTTAATTTTNDYQMNQVNITSPHNRLIKPYRLNKSSKDILINEPKLAHFNSTYEQIKSSVSTSLPNTRTSPPFISITNHFGPKINPTRKSASSYLTNLNLVIDSTCKHYTDNTSTMTTNNNNNNNIQATTNSGSLPIWKSFYIKKMVEFGFNPYDEQNQKFKSKSNDSNLNHNNNEFDLKKSIKRLKSSMKLDKSSKLTAISDNKLVSVDINKHDLYSSQSKSYYDFSSQKNRSATKFFSPSLIILPELDETVAINTSFKDINLNTSSNNSNDDNIFSTNTANFVFDTNNNINQNKMSRQMSSANKTGRSELTLPPIVEAKVNNYNNKKSNSSNRVDSGIAVEYGNENQGSGGGGGGGWHLSSNASENGVENVITTIEIVEPNSTLKKNGTSSTLNSYGKSSSIQSKQSLNNNANSSKLGYTNSNLKQIKASLSPATNNEANYLANVEKLNNLNVNNDEDYLQVNKKNTNQNDTSKTINNNKQPNTPKFDTLSRQNTLTTINNNNNHENLPLVSKQNLNQSVSTTQQQQKPVPKPRRNDIINSNQNNKRALSLQRQNTQMPNENSQFLKENNGATVQDKKLLKRESTTLGQSKGNLNPTPNNAVALRPKTGNANTRTIVTFNINTDQENSKNPKSDVDQDNNSSKPVGLTASALVKPNEFDILKYNEETENVIAALNLLEHDEQTMNDFTMMRIMKWLEEVENCHNLMQPPSQIAWSNNQNGSDRNTQKRNSEFADLRNNFNNEYCLSDYDSLDEQIIEYNRVVDKTYHIVHDED